MNKTSLIFKYFQKKDLLRVKNKEYQKTLSSLFTFLVENDKVKEDKTGNVVPDKKITAKVLAREKGIAAGIEELCFLIKNFTSLSLKPKIKDGEEFEKDDIIAEINGGSREILAYERTMLNILQRASGIATQTNRMVTIINKQIFIAATRKTPWMTLDKKAVAVGGGLTHRLSLADGILVKDNHLESLRVVHHLKDNTEAITKALEMILPKVKNQLVEVEVKNENEAIQAITTFQEGTSNNYLALLFDNFTPEQLQQTIQKLNKQFDLGNIITEASGGINEGNLLQWTETGVDILSLGALTHSTEAANLSLEF